MESKQDYVVYLVGKLRFAYFVTLVCAIVFTLAGFDAMRFYHTGQFFLHPLLYILVFVGSLGLIFVATCSTCGMLARLKETVSPN